VQKLTGIINWVHPYSGITNQQLKPLSELLKGVTDILAIRSLTKEDEKTIELVEDSMMQKFVWRNSPEVELQVFILIQEMPFAMLVQWNSNWPDPLHIL
ncbi:POK25 protein, partial [Alcedo cyanopectus]|nr:POK25 protein [Ceyx cyanopectus]